MISAARQDPALNVAGNEDDMLRRVILILSAVGLAVVAIRFVAHSMVRGKQGTCYVRQ